MEKVQVQVEPAANSGKKTRRQPARSKIPVLVGSNLSGTPVVVVPQSRTQTKTRSLRRRRTRTRKGGRTSLRDSTRTVSGRDFIGFTNVPIERVQPGTGILHLALNPRLFLDTRLQAESRLWNRWRPLKLRVTVTTNISSLGNGSIGLGWTEDPDDAFPTGRAGVTRLATLRPSTNGHLSEHLSIDIPSTHPFRTQNWYILDGESEDASHGQLIVMALSTFAFPGTSNNLITIMVSLDWEIEFSGPKVTPVGLINTIYAQDDYTPYFTDSSSDFEGGRYLTFKERSGGYPVPFPMARIGVVYKVDARASVMYYNSATDTTESRAEYACRAREYPAYPILVLFLNLANAKSYAAGGSISLAIDFKKVSSVYVTPSNPAWYEQSDSFLDSPYDIPPVTADLSLPVGVRAPLSSLSSGSIDILVEPLERLSSG